MTYKEYKENITQEINDFTKKYCIWAFSQKQLDEALKEHNLTEKEFQDNYCSFFGGGAIRQDKVQEYLELTKRQDEELKELMKDEQFAYEALYYELTNHEYGYTYDATDTLASLNLTAEDIEKNQVLNRAFCKAANEIKESQY